MSGQQRRVRRPKSVKVGYLVYSIHFMSEDEWAKSGRNMDWAGGSEHEEARIVLRVVQDRSEDSLRETLLHEITHCVWVNAGINHLWRYSKADPGDMEEMVVCSQSPGMLAVLAENPAVLAYLINLGQPA